MAYAELGRIDDGRTELAEVMRLAPAGGLDSDRLPYKDPATLQRMQAAIERLAPPAPTE